MGRTPWRHPFYNRVNFVYPTIAPSVCPLGCCAVSEARVEIRIGTGTKVATLDAPRAAVTIIYNVPVFTGLRYPGLA